MSATETMRAPYEAQTKQLLIDTDVHENLASKMDLLPYVDEYWQHYMRTYQFDRSQNTPSAWPYTAMLVTRGRAEWTSEDGTIGRDLDKLRTDLLENEGVTHAILNGQFYPAFMSGNYGFAHYHAGSECERQRERK